jgi:hypothetical protein
MKDIDLKELGRYLDNVREELEQIIPVASIEFTLKKTSIVVLSLGVRFEEPYDNKGPFRISILGTTSYLDGAAMKGQVDSIKKVAVGHKQIVDDKLKKKKP